ncbi:MAG TPA: YceI family protein [Gammaproteobacteria bacterium]|nr:YceI family protein [Gammaproteobacteria bacterium]
MRSHVRFLSRYRQRFGLLLAISMAALAGCSQVPVKAPAMLAALPPLITKGAIHYTIEPDRTNVRFLVYRAGPLAAFGHNHVIRAGAVHGDIYLNRRFPLSGFEFALPVDEFRVDEPAARAAEGSDFAEQPSPQAISGTTRNMLGPGVLDAARYPEVSVRSVAVDGSLDNPTATIRITLHGVQRDITVPLALKVSGRQLTADGRFAIKQSDFGITPFSILGGGLQVADTVKVEFHIAAVAD